MAMIRRDFLRSLTLGLVGSYMATSLPARWIPTGLQQESAMKFLTTAWNTHAKGSGSKGSPKDIYVSDRVYTAFKGELKANQRFVFKQDTYIGPPALAFKSSRLYNEGTSGWYARMESGDGRVETYT